MTDSATPPTWPPLGVGSLLGQSFSLVFRNFGSMMLVGAVPAIMGAAISFAIYGSLSQDLYSALMKPPEFDPDAELINPFVELFVAIAGLLLWGFASASMTAAAYAAATGQSISVSRALSAGIAQIHWVVICMLLAAIAVGIASALMIVPGLYLAALWFLLVPILVVEKTGFGAFGRSVALTKEYRWPLVGLILLFFLANLLVGIVTGTLQAMFQLMGSVGVLAIALIEMATGAFFYALMGALVALTYSRLVELKEGTSVSSLADIFS